jgi:CHAT domain-containing protein/tetratricopeptide (TPR) repeat protein
MRPLRITAVVCSATVALAVASCRSSDPAAEGRAALAAAVSTTLPFSARLSGGFAPSQQGPTRAGNTPTLSPDTRIAIAELEKRATAEGTPEAQADLGVGYLVQGDIDRAITTIEDAALQLQSPAPWSDLSAAYLARAERTPGRRVEYLARALEAAEKSLKILPSNDALFNRALARDGLAPYTGTPAPWSDYASAETDPAWRDAAAREANNDRPIDDVRDRWEARRKQLPAKLNAGDVEFVNETARLFPEATIEFLEREVLIDQSALPAAPILAAAIGAASGDPLAREEVAAMRSNSAAAVTAHQSYARGRAQTEANDLAGARRSLIEARDAFKRIGAPYALLAETRLADVEWREGHFDVAQRMLASVERTARSRGYHTLLARVLWQRGAVLNRQWRLTEALEAFREGASLFDAANQRENAASVYSNLADALRMLGEAQESWVSIGRTLESLPDVRRPIRRYLFLYNASLFATRHELNEPALLFQDAAVREAGKAATDVLTEALVQRALVHVRRGDDARARADLDQATRQAAATTSEAFRSYINAELNIVRAQVAGNTNAVADLQNAITFFSRTEPGRVPGLYLLLARTPVARASRDTAEGALRSGIDSLEAQHAGLGDEALRISYFDESWSLFQQMVSLQLAAKNPGAAFEYAERSRARSLLASAQGSAVSRTRSLAQIQSQLTASVVLLHYSTLAERVLIWTITSSDAQLVERRIDERELARLVDQHREAIRDRRERRANDRLYNLLIEPVAASLPASAVVVLVPDGPLHQLPFATLRHPATRRYLIEDRAVMVSPSASFFVDAGAASTGRPHTPLASALLVGNPAADGVRALPGAESEVEIASKLYPRHEVLVGRRATKDRFLQLAPGYDVVHFGGHALANAEFPLLSRLMFADEGEGEESLFAHEIARIRFPRTRVVVLAACSTAAGAVSRGEGVVSVARPFLGGGVPLVIASQWDVDDRATQQLTLAFHRELAQSGDPVRALRAAQLTLLRSGDAVQSLPESWGAFVAVGTVTH